MRRSPIHRLMAATHRRTRTLREAIRGPGVEAEVPRVEALAPAGAVPLGHDGGSAYA